MKNINPRSLRVAEQIQRELAIVLLYEMKDPRVASVTITAVKVSNDLGYAKVYFVLVEQDKQNEIEKVLNSAAGFFRSRLSEKMNMRLIPKIKFIYDESISRGVRIMELVDEAMLMERSSGLSS